MKREKEVFGLRGLRREVVPQRNRENPRQGMKVIIYKTAYL